KRIVLPSGDQTGSTWLGAPCVSARAPPPPAFITYSSRFAPTKREKAICLPFGDQAGSMSPPVAPCAPATPPSATATAMPQANAQTLAAELASTATLYMVLDWDGTVTVRDTQWMLLERFGDRELF